MCSSVDDGDDDVGNVCRFSYKGNTLLLVGSRTEYYRHMPAGYRPIHVADLPLLPRRWYTDRQCRLYMSLDCTGL